MAAKTDFTDAEWLALRKGAVGSGLLVSVIDRDFTDSFGEASAMAKYLNQQRLAGTTDLIRDLAKEGNPYGVTTPPDRLRDETMNALRTSVALLSEKAPDDLDAYRAFVLGIANDVADAKSGRSDVESTMIEQIRLAVGS